MPGSWDSAGRRSYNKIGRGKYIHTCKWWDEERYSADKAQQLHAYRQTNKGRPLKIGNDREYARFLEEKMLGVQEDGSIDRRKRYSPAAALAAAQKEGYQTSVCVSTLYSYITKRVFLHLTNKDLWEKGKKKKQGYRPVRRVAHPALPSIAVRPEEINQREEKGPWEIDLVVGKTGSKPVLLTMIERKEREPLVFKLPDKRAESVRKVFDRLERMTPDFHERFKSITTDNSSEFLEYEQLIQSIHGGKLFDVYYCHSYSAWEKGSNENFNRMIRRWTVGFSEKQRRILRWPYTGRRALICDGAVRSGKTSVMSLSFVLWAMGAFDGRSFAICGKTVGSAERNIIQPLLSVRYLQEHFTLTYSRSEHVLTVSRGGRSNRFYVFGGRDESSYEADGYGGMQVLSVKRI